MNANNILYFTPRLVNFIQLIDKHKRTITRK